MVKEGDVVVVTAQVEDRIRPDKEIEPVGTLISLGRENAVVLFPSGEVWVGSKKFVFKHEE